uniref:Uncharacterized protein n=1 Tax=Anguilla anguilla TaxID=7936 RepID=A0A0E9TMY4_ANGAN
MHLMNQEEYIKPISSASVFPVLLGNQVTSLARLPL